MNIASKLLVVGAVAALVGLLDPTQVFTCSCIAPPPPKKALEQSVAVFSAKVIKIEDDKAPSTLRVTLQVAHWWKGGESATIIVTTQKSGAACGYGFQPDTHYLVYAHGEKGAKSFTVSLCSRTRTLAQADQSGDLKELGEGKAPPKK